jgi:hypothetical protein
VAVHPDWETAKEWAKSTFTKESMGEAALCAATVGVIGFVVLCLHRAMQSYLILGF